jgi:hypothetical protein
MTNFPRWLCLMRQLAGTLLALLVDASCYVGLCLRSLAAENGLPGAPEQKSTLARPVCWTLRSCLRPTCLSEVLGVVPVIRWQPERVA